MGRKFSVPPVSGVTIMAEAHRTHLYCIDRGRRGGRVSWNGLHAKKERRSVRACVLHAACVLLT